MRAIEVSLKLPASAAKKPAIGSAGFAKSDPSVIIKVSNGGCVWLVSCAPHISTTFDVDVHLDGLMVSGVDGQGLQFNGGILDPSCICI